MGSLGIARDLGYFFAMNSPVSAITQIGDLAFALYQGSLPKDLSISREDLGIDGISFEMMEGSGEAVKKLFKVIGLEKMDKFGKATIINAAYQKVKKIAANGDKDYFGYLKPEEIETLFSDLEKDEKTEIVKFVLFNELSDFQPVSTIEMPEHYATGGNARIMYMLKSYSIKQIDVFRREAYEKIRDGRKEGNKEKVAEGVRNLFVLAALLMLCNGTADVIKAVFLGRPIKVEDLLADNVFRLFGISKYLTYKIAEEGIMSGFARLLTPAAPWLEYPVKDVWEAGDGKGLESVQLIPVVGKEIYWWFGKGHDKSMKKKYGM